MSTTMKATEVTQFHVENPCSDLQRSLTHENIEDVMVESTDRKIGYVLSRKEFERQFALAGNAVRLGVGTPINYR